MPQSALPPRILRFSEFNVFFAIVRTGISFVLRQPCPTVTQRLPDNSLARHSQIGFLVV